MFLTLGIIILFVIGIYYMQKGDKIVEDKDTHLKEIYKEFPQLCNLELRKAVQILFLAHAEKEPNFIKRCKKIYDSKYRKAL